MSALALIRRVCGSAALLFVCLSSQAAISPSTQYTYYVNWSPTGWPASQRHIDPTPLAACTRYAVTNNVSGYSSTVVSAVEGAYGCVFTLANGSPSNPYKGHITADNEGVSCPSNSTGTTSCTCNSGYVENSTATACEVQTGSPNGATAPSGPLGEAPLAISAAIALGILAVGAGLLGAPLIGVTALISGAVASGIIASPLWTGGVATANNADSAIFSGGSPLTVKLEPSATLTVGSLSSTPAVGVNTSNKFVPAGGGTSTGGASGGWEPGAAAGEYTYKPPPVAGVAQPAIAAITNGGYDYRAVTAYTGDAPAGSISVKRYTDGSMNIVQAFKAPVVTSSGEVTTALIGVSKSFGASGQAIAGSTGASIGPTLGNGSASNSGAGIALFPSSGATVPGSGETAPAADPCGAPGQPVCSVKVDETGMQQEPNATGLDKIDEAKADFDSGIESIIGDEGKDTGWGMIPSWLNHVGACQPTVLWTLPAKMGGQTVTMDLCPLLPGIYLVMNWLWVIWTFFIVVGLVLRTTTKAA